MNRDTAECGLDLGTQGEIQENRPEAGALVAKTRDRVFVLGRDAAAKVLVDPATRPPLDGST